MNVGKSKVMRCTRNEDGARLNVMLNGEAHEVDQLKYLGSVIAANGGVEADVPHRVNEGCKVLGARGRHRFGWMDGVKRALNDSRMDVMVASEHARNSNEW